MSQISIIMPMAGRGSRFSRLGIKEPKPLIKLADKPFFWWAIESIKNSIEIGELIMVVLEEHIKDFAIDAQIHKYYPHAKIIALPEVTSGAAQTAAIGVAKLENNGPFAVQDCDHAFALDGLDALVEKLNLGLGGALVGFKSNSPNYSYVKLNDIENDNKLISGTVEKQVISPFAIAGCYFFASPQLFLDAYHEYIENCQYDEAFLSGVYNILCQKNFKISFQELKTHISFGTPEELEQVNIQILQNLWKEGN